MKNYFVVWTLPSCHDGDEWCGIANSYRELLEIYQKELNSEEYEDNISFGLQLTVFEYTKEKGFKEYKITDEMVLSDNFKNINLNFRFKVVAVKKKSLSVEQNSECENLILALQEKTEMTRFNETVFIKEEIDNSDVAFVVFFAKKLKDCPEFFDSVIIYDLETDNIAVLI